MCPPVQSADTQVGLYRRPTNSPADQNGRGICPHFANGMTGRVRRLNCRFHGNDEFKRIDLQSHIL